jgi:hypothetical protein
MERPQVLSSSEHIQQQLDDALADTFPASDPVSIVISQVEEWDASAPGTSADQGERDLSGVKKPAS